MSECGLTNLAACIPEKLYDFFLGIVNAPLQPLLNLVKTLLQEPVNVDLFIGLWAVIIYVISLFYGILFMYAGFNFMISGYDIEKRENAKSWFKNIVIMIILVQASFFIYSLLVELGALLSAGVLNMIDSDFFLLTANNLANIGFELFFSFFYFLILFFTLILLIIRYIIVCIGAVFFPIGIFLYFISPLRDYGKMIINFLLIAIFVGFLDSIILLVCGKLIEIELFQYIKILVMICAFLLVNAVTFYLMLFATVKSAFKSTEGIVSKVKIAAATVAKIAA